ncbi:MAG: type I-F CRISPR-associated helicase Cas3f [Bradyrhizobium sp.]|uniref:type I-F CRISPR-associated helicase Cas3f n=1 Tax=Bradyrhizobium sp. TaxID=376 RepID=UPI003D0C4285
MNILLISECDKRALTETRRILDQFAERRGERSWQTPITQEGLDTLRRLLRKSARKNTAVACHWIRGRDHSELLWIVGDARRFNRHGAVPTNTTTRNILRRGDENDWHTGEDIYLLSSLAALLHDLGKACRAFQQRLRNSTLLETNLYRHEWVSLRLFQAFVGRDDDAGWLQRLMNPTEADDAAWLGRLQRDGLDQDVDKPFERLPPLASAIGWLVLTHHRLPVMPSRAEDGTLKRLGAKVSNFRSDQLRDVVQKIDAGWNEQTNAESRDSIGPYWEFQHGLPVTTHRWRKRAAHLARRLLQLRQQAGKEAWLDDPYVMHLARLSLMLSDHHYSSLTDKTTRVAGEDAYPLYANTCRVDGRTALNQPLDEHLLGVEAHNGLVSHALPGFERHLPALTRHRGLRKRAGDSRFRWQDKAADTAEALRGRSRAQGAFFINMASTGSGKTLANARIMYGLADPELGARFCVALGLRTLTLQTGRTYRDTLALGDDELAIRVGGAASRELFEHHEAEAEKNGSASRQDLLSDDSFVVFDGNVDAHPLLQRAIKDRQVKALLAAPILVCTVDHLTPATESRRGGGQIAPMLRLMSSDLVLDEIDDFDLDDLPALARLVHWAGMLGSHVMLSSATLPPALVQGLFCAYREGRTLYHRNRGEPGRQLDICCAWFDEFDTEQAGCADDKQFAARHETFVLRRQQHLAQAVVRRRSEVVPLAFSSRKKEDVRREFAARIRDCALRLHQRHHETDPGSAKRISFGLARMANIEPIFDVALHLFRIGAPDGYRIHLCVYHSQFPLLIRSEIERRLDTALNRRRPEAVFRLPDVRDCIDGADEQDQIFIVLGSPITEVGRDHSYNWGIVEPSSMRSLIQLAGRIERHREKPCDEPNLMIFDYNLRHFEHPDTAAYCMPGFEGDNEFRLTEHRLHKLLDEEERAAIDARPRIIARPRERRRPRENLVDLEHARLERKMLPAEIAPLTARQQSVRRHPPLPPLGAHSWWTIPRASLTAVLQQQDPFRHDTQKRRDLVLLPDDAEEDYRLAYLHRPNRHALNYVLIEDSHNHRIDDAAVRGAGVSAWMEIDYMQALRELAQERGMDLESCAKRFGTVRVADSEFGWRFHPVLGFTRQT